MNIDFSKLTAPNGALEDVRKLIFLQLLDPENLGALVEFYPNVLPGDAVDYIGGFGLMGKPAQGCDPTYGDSLLPTVEKKWEIADWEIMEKLCWKNLESTVVKYELKFGTNVGDLTESFYMDNILKPAVAEAVRAAIFRIAWFSDTNVTAYSSTNTSGELVEGTDASYFNLTPGLFARLAAGVAAGTVNSVSIAANSETTLAKQRSEIRKAGVAMGIFDDLIENSDPILRADGEGQILVTLALADALGRDIRNNNKGSDLHWESLFDGVKMTQYNGVKIIAIPFWDQIIKGYYKGAAGDALLRPYRAVYANKRDLMVGSKSKDAVADLEVFYEKKSRLNYLQAMDSLGTLLGQDNLISVAW